MRESLGLVTLALQTSSNVHWHGYSHVNELQAEVHLEFLWITVWKWLAVSSLVKSCDLVVLSKILPYIQSSFPILRDLSRHHFPPLKFGIPAINTRKILDYLNYSFEAYIPQWLVLMLSVCYGQSCSGCLSGRASEPSGAPLLLHEADVPAWQPRCEAATRAAAACCLTWWLGNLLLWQFASLKCRVAAKSHCVSCYAHMEKSCLHRLFGLKSVRLTEHVKQVVCIQVCLMWLHLTGLLGPPCQTLCSKVSYGTGLIVCNAFRLVFRSDSIIL